MLRMWPVRRHAPTHTISATLFAAIALGTTLTTTQSSTRHAAGITALSAQDPLPLTRALAATAATTVA